MNYRDRIRRDPQICGGEPVFQGTRVTLRTVLASLAAGDSAEQIIADFPNPKAGGHSSGDRVCGSFG